LSDYGKLIDRQLTNAFKKLDSLMTTATFNLKSGEDYNFSNAEVTVTSDKDKTVRLLVIQTEQKKEVTYKKLLMRTIPELDLYDTCSLGGQKWNVGPVIFDSGATTILQVYRG